MNAPILPDEDRPWRWRNCRNVTVTFNFHLMPWQWFIKAAWSAEVYDACGILQFGPLALNLWCDIGNCSTGDWRARYALSEAEAWERAR